MLTLLFFIGFVIMTGLWLSAKHNLRQERMFENEDINDAPVGLSVFSPNEIRREASSDSVIYLSSDVNWFQALPNANETRIIELEEELKRAYDNLEMVLNSTDPLACHNIEKENA